MGVNSSAAGAAVRVADTAVNPSRSLSSVAAGVAVCWVAASGDGVVASSEATALVLWSLTTMWVAGSGVSFWQATNHHDRSQGKSFG